MRLSPRLLVPLSLLLLLAQTSQPDAAKSLAAHLAALKDTNTLEGHFTCEKRLAALETPLISRGRLWIKKGDPRDGDGAVRFSTDTPYVSELILAKGKNIARSQHETQWTETNQSARPGLYAVLTQLSAWSTGVAAKVAESYTITATETTVPDRPSDTTEKQTSAPADGFILTPTNKDLAKVIKHITLAIDRQSHHLLFIEIVTQQDDVTRYWFYDIKTNADLPANIFTPSAALTTSPAKDKP